MDTPPPVVASWETQERSGATQFFFPKHWPMVVVLVEITGQNCYS